MRILFTLFPNRLLAVKTKAKGPATGQIVALRPVQVYSDDYAFREYGFTEKQMERLEKNLAAKDAAALKYAKLRPWRP